MIITIDRPQYIHAIQALAGGVYGVGGSADGPIEKIYYPDDFTPPSEEDIQAKLKELQVEYDTEKYARDRIAAYPSTGDQLDYIYHNGVAKWKTDMIDPVKTKYPKG